MKRKHLGVLLALVLPAISVQAQGMRGGEGRGPEGGGGARVASVSYHGSYGHGGTVVRSGFGGRVGFTHGAGFHGGYQGVYWRGGYGRHYYYRRGYGGALIVYGYGLPYYYPYGALPYYGAPAYGDYSAAPDDSYAVQPDYPSAVVPDTSPDDESSPATAYVAQDAQGYYQVGDQWGAGMKQYKLTMDQLVTYLKSYIVDASPAQQDAFRSGFIASAVPNAAATYDQAMQQAVPES